MSMFLPLRDIDYISAYVPYISLFWLSVSAYKRTKQKGFVWLGFGAILSLLNSPMPFQSAQTGYAHRYTSHSAMYFKMKYGVGVVSNILLLVGLALIIKAYVKLSGASRAAPPTAPTSD